MIFNIPLFILAIIIFIIITPYLIVMYPIQWLPIVVVGVAFVILVAFVVSGTSVSCWVPC